MEFEPSFSPESNKEKSSKDRQEASTEKENKNDEHQEADERALETETTTQKSMEEKEEINHNKLFSEEIVEENIDNLEFRKSISPVDPENISKQDFYETFDNLLEIKSEIPKEKKAELFKQTLEYYANVEKMDDNLLMHSTSSFSLRKGLEEGFSGGKIAGGEKAREISSEKKDQPLSVSRFKYPTAESFQQMWAKMNAKNYEDLLINSEEITGKTLPEVFYKSFAEQLTKKEKKELLAKRETLKNKSQLKKEVKEEVYRKFKNAFGQKEGEIEAKNYFKSNRFKEFIDSNVQKVTTEEISDEKLNQLFSEENIEELIEDFENRDYSPDIKNIKEKVLKNIEDKNLREELEKEAKDPFPCMIIFDGGKKLEDLHSRKKRG